MGIAALISWLMTAVGGFYLIITGLIGDEARDRGSVARSLPLPVAICHALLALGGLMVWYIYLLVDWPRLAWAAFATLVAAALLGTTMGSRWIRVRRSPPPPAPLPGYTSVGTLTVPAVRSYQGFVVLGHGVFAAITMVLVLLTALGKD